jgi:alkanesulfonate monooxygenase SsuD/methylene tetrahydromethanopterin reductase-like flavin-dependent oxidoreductase (luciferase family)
MACAGKCSVSDADFVAGHLCGAGRRPRACSCGGGRGHSRHPRAWPGPVGRRRWSHPREWADIGHERPSPRQRAERLVEFVESVAALLRGQTVTREGGHLALRESRLEGLPVGQAVRLCVGGGHPLILRTAAAHADVVALSGLGRTLPDGHRHEVRWSQADLDHQLRIVRDEAQLTGNRPDIEALVQAVEVTENRTAAIEALSQRIPGATAQDLAHTPFLLIGTREEMAAQMLKQAEELGITRYVIREAAVPALERVLALIRSRSTSR